MRRVASIVPVARRSSEQPERDLVARLCAVIETAVDGIVTIDAGAVIESFNPAAERIFGYAAAEVIGRNVSVLMPEPDRGAHQGFVERYLATGVPRVIGIGRRVEAQRKDGTVFPVDLAVARMTVAGEVMFTGICRDVTDRVRMERELLEQSRRLETANDELAAFCYSVSHDLRAPLRAINGFSRALIEDHGPFMDETARAYLGRVVKASDTMGRLVDDMLKLFQLSRAPMSEQTVDLSTMAEAVSAELAGQEPRRAIAVAIEPGVTVRGDPSLLRIALHNLMANAWKFTGKRPDPRIAFGSVQKDGRRACFVRDNGVGFDMAQAARLFAPFQRLHGADEFDGSGIGLATVARVIHRHGGRVWAEGVPGAGAAFYFSI